MNGDPHPLVGWARFLQWQRLASSDLTQQDVQRLNEAIHEAERVYKHWRPELRYKLTDVAQSQFDQVRRAAKWFHGRARTLVGDHAVPVIRGKSSTIALTPSRRNTLLKQLVKELKGLPTANGPLVFEIPLEQSDRIDVLAVWQALEDLRSEDRTELILDAYKGQHRKIAQALGVTHQEAMEQQLLPYAVVPITRRGEADLADLRGHAG